MFFFSLSCVPYSCIFFSFFRFRLIVKFFFFSLFPSPRHDFTTLSLLSAVSTLDYIFLRSSPRSFPFPILLFHHNFLSFAVPRSKLSIYSCKVRSKDSTPFEPHLFTFHPFYHPLHFPFPTRSRKREIEQIFNPRKNSPMPVTRFVKIQSGEHVPRFRKETDIFSSNRVKPSLFENSSHRPASLVRIAIKSAGQFWPATRNCFVLIDRWDRWATAQLPSKRPA